MQYMLLVYDDPTPVGERHRRARCRRSTRSTPRSPQRRERRSTARSSSRHRDREDRPGQGRRDARHRRPVRRDEGDARRLLPRRGRLDRGGARARREDPVRAHGRLGRGPPDRGDVAMQYMLLIYGDEASGMRSRGRARALCEEYGGSATTCARREAARRRGAAADRDRDDRAGARRRRRRHRRALRGDEGGARRLLPDRGRLARRGDRVGGEDPSARAYGTIEMRPVVDHCGDRRIDELARAYRDERARCIAILGRVLGDLDLAEDAVQDAFVTRRRALAARRRAGEPRRLDRRDGAQPRDRPDPPRADARAQDGAARARRAAARRRGEP